MPRPLLALAAVCLLALTSAPARAERLDAHVPIGGTVDGEVATPGGVFTAGFLVNDGLKRNVSIKIKRAKGATLALDVALIDPEGNQVDVAAAGGKVKASEKAYKAALKDIGVGGVWRIEVRGEGAGTGAFSVNVKAKDVEKLAGSDIVVVGGTTDILFRAGDAVELTVQVKRARGSSLVPEITICDPNGAVVPESVGAAAVSTKSGSAKLGKFVLPVFGAYCVRLEGAAGTGGGFSYKISTKPSKLKGDRPVADPGESFSVEPSGTGTLDGTGSSGRGGMSYLWAQVRGPHVQFDDASSATPTFTAPADDTDLAFELSVFDGLRSRPRLVEVAIAKRPIAVVGASQRVEPGASVTLDATGSVDRRGQGLVPTWRVISGSVTLDDESSFTPTFGAPATPGVVRLGLVVDDGRARSLEVEQVVAVSATPTQVADAGRSQLVRRMATVHLSGLASQRSGQALEDGAAWTQVAGEPVTLSGATTYIPNFTAPRRTGDLEFELRIDGNASTAHRTRVFVRDGIPGAPPIVTAASSVTPSAGNALLNASGTTDPDGDAVSVRWAQVDGSPLAIDDPVALQTSLSGATNAIGIWQLAVQAWDQWAYGPPELVRVTNTGYADKPFASAGVNRSVNAAQVAGLDGGASVLTSGGGPLTYIWRQVSGLDWYDVAVSDPTFNRFIARPQFTLPPDLSSLDSVRTLTFELVVSDGARSSLPDLMTVRFSGLPLNGSPTVTADASDLEPVAGQQVTLLGTADDRDGDDVTVVWQQTAGPAVALFPSNTSLTPSFTSPASGALTFRIVGNDGFEDGTPATVTIDVNEAPVAVPTVTPQDGPPGTTVTLSAANSSDPEAQPLSYLWEQVSGTAVTFTPTDEEFSFSAPGGVLVFRLTVNDGRQDSSPVGIGFGSTPPPTVAPTANRTSAPYGASVSLQANPAGGDTTGVTFTWRQISGPTTSLSSATAQNPSFTVPSPNAAPFGGTSASLPTARFGVKATREGQDSAEVTIDISYFASFNDPNGLTSTTVYGVIQQNCLSCHTTTSNNCSTSGARKYGINGATAFINSSVNVTACSSSKSYVVPGSASASFTLDRLKGIGGAMPPGSSVGTTNINLIQDWISQGANSSN